MDEQENVNVYVDTEEERYPVLGIREADGERGPGFTIPSLLFAALQHARKMVEIAETAIMEHIGHEYPDAGAVADWLEDHTEDAALEAAMAAWAAEHPEGPDWRLVPVRERQRLIDIQKGQ